MHPEHTSQPHTTDNSRIQDPLDIPSKPDLITYYSSIARLLNECIHTKQLVRILVNRGRGVKLSIPCRIISYDPDSELVTTYHVDEKQVYTFKLTEIEDLVAY